MADFRAWVEQNKALWTRVYDEVIHPDLEEEWKKSMCSMSACAYTTANDQSGEEKHKEELKQSAPCQTLGARYTNDSQRKSRIRHYSTIYKMS